VSLGVPTAIPGRLSPGNYHLLAAVKPSTHGKPTPIAAQAQTFAVASSSASHFEGLFARETPAW
jgi:hypothetical protein